MATAAARGTAMASHDVPNWRIDCFVVCDILHLVLRLYHRNTGIITGSGHHIPITTAASATF
jgi:isochorismate hydrolase